MEERLQKYMARCGVASRRKSEELIAEGLVEINGAVVREPGVKIDPARDRIKVDGKLLRLEKSAYYIHHKVKGVTTTVSDDLGRRTVMDCLPDIRERVYPVGRLDKDSEGLLVLTNDGQLANYLTHPAYGVGKTYRVVAEGRVPEETLTALAEKGIRLGPVLIKPSHVELVRYDNDNTIVLIAVAEGINREVRRIFAALGHEVKRLLRTRVGPLELAGLKRGDTRPLTPKEIATLHKGMAGMSPETEAEAFPAASAKTRKPTGPRGRPRRTPAPRRGKPDPADMRPAPRARPAKGSVVVDDWKKTVRTGAQASRGRNAGKTAGADAPKQPRTLRPTRAAPKPAAEKPAWQPRRTASVNHPLAAPKPRPAGRAAARPTSTGPARPPRQTRPARKGPGADRNVGRKGGR
jgi:23S rRNA pseudouridine2605 synthase